MKTNINELNTLINKFKTAASTSNSTLNSMTRSVKSTIQEVRSSYSSLNYACTSIASQVDRISKLQQRLIAEIEDTSQALDLGVKVYYQSEKEGMALLSSVGLGKVSMKPKPISSSVGKVATFSSLEFLQNVGVTIDESEGESKEEIVLEDAINTSKNSTEIIGNVLEIIGSSSLKFSELFKDGLQVINNGEHIKIKASAELRGLLKLPKKIKVSSVARAGENSAIYKNINKAFKLEKLTKYIKASNIEKIAKGINKVAPWLTTIGVGLDVGSGIYDNIQKGAKKVEIVGDAIGDTAVAAGGVWVATVGASKGAAGGAAIGTMVLPVIGTVIGAGVGAIGGAIGSGWLYKKVTEIKIDEKSIHEWVNTATTGICDGIADGAAGLYNGAKDFIGNVGDGISDGWDNICDLFN